MKINRFAATAVLAIGVTVAAAGTAAADPDPGPGITQSVDELAVPDPDASIGAGDAIAASPDAVEVATPVDDPDTVMHQCNAILGALIGGVIGGTGSALPGALIGAGIGALIGWSLLYPPGPPLACWQPAPPPPPG